MLSHSKGILQLTWFSFSNYIDFIDYFRHLSEHIPKLSVLPVMCEFYVVSVFPKNRMLAN
jgi:hypothetical protein